jgi:cell division initiation protein
MLTPHDVEIVEFPKKMFGGYNEDAVDEFLDEVVRSLMNHIEETEKLNQDLKKLASEVETHKAKEKLVSDSVALAQKTRDQVIDDAKREAEIIVREARLEEVRIKNELGSLKSERDSFEYEFYGLLMGFIKKLESRRGGIPNTRTDSGIKENHSDEHPESTDSGRRSF